MAQSQKVSFNPGYKKPSFFKLVAQNKTLLLMCLPAVVFFFIFSYMPMPGAYIAFTNFQYNKGIWASPFVGLQNFKFLFTSGQLTLLLRNTILYNVAFIVLGNFLQLLFAILLNEVQSKRYKKTTQSMMFLPYFISDVLVSLLVYNLLNYDFQPGSFHGRRNGQGLPNAQCLAVYHCAGQPVEGNGVWYRSLLCGHYRYGFLHDGGSTD